MSLLIRHGEVVSDDPYQAVDDLAPLPAGPVIVSLARWAQEAAALNPEQRAFGVRLPNTADVLALDAAVLRAPLIVLEFPAFADGRAYSQARLLRDRRGYSGELRATGAAVVRDQLLGMARCGIDSFQLRADQSAEAGAQVWREFSRAYQPGSTATDSLPPVRRLRAG
jgi:uncharacterized protein (DUF934 family)